MFYRAFEKYNFCAVSSESIVALSENLQDTLNHLREWCKVGKYKGEEIKSHCEIG